jgi:ribonuclease R
VLNTNVSNATRKQQAKDKAEGKQPKAAGDLTVWDALGVHCSANERRADEASRDVENWLKCYFMQDKLGEEYTGIITGVTTFGIFVQLDQLFVEGMVHITDLGQDYFQYDDARHELKGERSGKKFQLTDRVSVQVVRVDLESRKIDLRLAGVDAVAPRPDAPSKDRKTNIKPGPSTPSAKPGKPARNGAAAQPAAKPKAASRKTKAAAPTAAAPRAANPASKSKKKR